MGPALSAVAGAGALLTTLGSQAPALLDPRKEERRKGLNVSWAYPNPYESESTSRFNDWNRSSAVFRENKVVWNLRGLYEKWQTSEDDETWPWVWCQRNESGPHHVFVNVGPNTLSTIRDLVQENEKSA